MHTCDNSISSCIYYITDLVSKTLTSHSHKYRILVLLLSHDWNAICAILPAPLHDYCDLVSTCMTCTCTQHVRNTECEANNGLEYIWTSSSTVICSCYMTVAFHLCVRREMRLSRLRHLVINMEMSAKYGRQQQWAVHLLTACPCRHCCCHAEAYKVLGEFAACISNLYGCSSMVSHYTSRWTPSYVHVSNLMAPLCCFYTRIAFILKNTHTHPKQIIIHCLRTEQLCLSTGFTTLC